MAIGHGVGEVTSGGYAAIARIPSEGTLMLPKGLTPRSAMQLGTAGLTAALCVLPILESAPKGATVLVTGASGGVGSVAVMLLSTLGFEVFAATGRADQSDYLRSLGAAQIVDRAELEEPGKPLDKQRWFGVVDTVGAKVLAGALRHVAAGGVVAACGMAGGTEFTTSIFPFILRNVTLHGILSFHPPEPELEAAWKFLAEHVDQDKLEDLTVEITLGQLRDYADKMIENKARGRIVVRPFA